MCNGFTIMAGNRVANLGLVRTAALDVDVFSLFISFDFILFDYTLDRKFSAVVIF